LSFENDVAAMAAAVDGYRIGHGYSLIVFSNPQLFTKPGKGSSRLVKKLPDYRLPESTTVWLAHRH
jgi:hypothetical protein